MTHGLILTTPDTPLTARAADLLAAGPADAQTLISYVCHLPSAPRGIAEHMATALFAGHTRFTRDGAGRWRLSSALADVALPPVSAALESGSYIVVDTETTGTSVRHGDRITEVAAVLVRDGTVKTVFESLINPQRPIPKFISQLTHISWDMVKNAPKFRDVCDELLGVLEGQIFVAHNADFDWRFISMEVQRATGRRLEGRRFCTVRMARRLLPNLRRRSLDHVTGYYGIEITARHRAGGDAFATAKVLQRLIVEARDRGCATVDDLERMLAGVAGTTRRSRRRLAMPQPVRDDTTA